MQVEKKIKKRKKKSNLLYLKLKIYYKICQTA